MMSRVYSFLASFFWGNWFLRVVQAMMFGIVAVFIYLCLFALSAIKQGELGVLAAAPLIFFFIPGVLVNVALLFGLRKVKDNKSGGNKTLVMSLSVLSIFIALALFVGFAGLL